MGISFSLFPDLFRGWHSYPAYAGPAYAGPAYGAPVYGAPAYGVPVYAGPAYGYNSIGSRRSIGSPGFRSSPDSPKFSPTSAKSSTFGNSGFGFGNSGFGNSGFGNSGFGNSGSGDGTSGGRKTLKKSKKANKGTRKNRK